METAMIHEDQLTNEPAPVAIGFDRQARIYGIGGPLAPELDSVGAVVEISKEGSDAGKKCYRCGQFKKVSEFYLNRHHRDKLTSCCKECSKAACSRWNAANREKVSARNKKWSADHPGQKVANNKKWLAANPSAREKINARIKKTPKLRLSRCVSRSMRDSLDNSSKNRRHWEDLVGFTVDQLRAHLEKHFLPGMTWENYGTYWHIDHKIPVAAFNFGNPEDLDFQKCWALKNLRPLDAKKNISKGARVERPFQPSLAISVK